MEGPDVNPIIYLVITLHVVFAVGLLVFVLLHSGKGTGLSSMFGGVVPSGASTSIIEKNLDRITITFALGFLFTSLVLMVTGLPF